MAKSAFYLTGMGFSLVFPALGVVAVSAAAAVNCGAALATYTFADMFLGVTGRAGGAGDDRAGVPVISSGGSRAGSDGAIADPRVKKRPSVCTAVEAAASSS